MTKKEDWTLIALVICAISGIGFVAIAQAINTDSVKYFDLPIIQFVQGMETPFLTSLLTTFTWIGSGFGVTPITLGICFVLFFKYNERQQSILFAFSIVSTILLNEGLKRVFTRSRPDLYKLMEAGGFSFPSGHTMMAVSLYAMIVYVTWPHTKNGRQRFLLVATASLFAFLIMVSRIYVGVHYPSDIMGGIFMSAFWLTLVLTIFHEFQRKKNIV